MDYKKLFPIIWSILFIIFITGRTILNRHINQLTIEINDAQNMYDDLVNQSSPSNYLWEL